MTSTLDSPVAPPDDAPEFPALSHRQILVIFSGLLLGMTLAALDQTIVSTALPRITGELGGIEQLSWVFTSYLLAATISTPLYGKLGDLFGRKLLFQIAIVVFTAGSIFCGLAQSIPQLVIFRAVQGIGAGGLMVLAMAMIAETVSPRERGRYQGYFGAVFGVTSIAGPLVGGFITDNLSWRWVFFVNVPVAVVAMVVIGLVVPKGTRHGNPTIDYLGAALLTAAITLLVLVTTMGGNELEWGSPTILLMAAGSSVLTVAFLVTERRAVEPIVPLRLFRVWSFNVSVGVTFVIGMALMGTISFLPVFLQVVIGASATNSGLLLLPLMGGMLVSSMGSGQLITRTGRYKHFPVIGLGLATLSMVLLATIDATTSRFTVSTYMLLLGVGMGMSMQVMILVTQNAVHTRDLGVATGTVSFFRSIGSSLGVALFGALFTSSLRERLGEGAGSVRGGGLSIDAIRALPDAVELRVVAAVADSVARIFLFGIPLVLAAWILSLLLKETPLRSSTDSDTETDTMATQL